MQTNLKALAVAAGLVLAAAPASAESQLAANAGLSPAEAAGLSLTELAVAKFNRNAGHDERQGTPVRGRGGDASQLAASAGLGPEAARGLTLTEIAVAKFNRNAGHDERQSIVPRGAVTAASRSAGAVWEQLAASAGIAPDKAARMTLGEIAGAKFERDTD